MKIACRIHPGLLILMGVLISLFFAAMGPEGKPLSAAVIGQIQEEAEVTPIDENSDVPSPNDVASVADDQDSALTAEAMFSYTARFCIGSDEYYIEDVSYPMDVKPYTSKGRSFIPVRFLAYACGLSDEGLSWSESTRTVTLKGSAGVLRMMLESNLVHYNDQVALMDVCPELRTGRVFLPARYVAEFFGFAVEWEADTRTVIISC